jgi:hypothetical protein
MSRRKDIFDAATRAQGIADPAIEKHAGELFGTPTAKNETPVEQRNAGPGRVLVEWIGDYGPLAKRRLAAAVQLDLLSAEVVEAWERYHRKVTTRIPGLTHHTMTRERDGMSETVTWGPWDYVQSVTIKDADTLLSGTFGHQFRIVGYTGQQPADMSDIDLYVTPLVQKGKIDAATVEQIEHIVIDESAPEALASIVTQSGGRLAAWTPTR